MERKDYNIQRIKKINKIHNSNDITEFLVKYTKHNNDNNNEDIKLYIEKEINIIKHYEDLIITQEERDKAFQNMRLKLNNEIQILSKISNDNIIKIYKFYENPENIYHIITENYQCNLWDIIRHQISVKKYLKESIVIKIFAQICLGVSGIHHLNMIHRNINPSNIYLFPNQVIKLSNFDLSRILDSSNEKSITFIKNTWKEYMSPEMGMNIPYSFKHDIWSLGILLFHLMSLKVPFNCKQLNEIRTIKKIDPNFIYIKLPNHYSKEIKNLCVDLLRAYPAERPDIETIINKYKIVKNEVNKIKMGNNKYFSCIKDIYKNEPKITEKNCKLKEDIDNKFKIFVVRNKNMKNNQKLANNQKNIENLTNLPKIIREHKYNLNPKLKIHSKPKKTIEIINETLPKYLSGFVIDLPESINSINLQNSKFQNSSESNKISSSIENK